jgi:hypothetical protein
MSLSFKLRFGATRIKMLAAEYEYEDNADALEAGKRIQAGDHSLANLLTIAKWKSRRSSGRILGNTEAEVADALRLAVSATTERAAVAVLTGLRGVDVPVASAILAAIDPARFTIIDRRALESLGIERPSPTVDFYLEYLAHCRQLASANGVSLRELDQALWQWSKSANA